MSLSPRKLSIAPLRSVPPLAKDSQTLFSPKRKGIPA